MSQATVALQERALNIANQGRLIPAISAPPVLEGVYLVVQWYSKADPGPVVQYAHPNIGTAVLLAEDLDFDSEIVFAKYGEIVNYDNPARKITGKLFR